MITEGSEDELIERVVVNLMGAQPGCQLLPPDTRRLAPRPDVVSSLRGRSVEREALDRLVSRLRHGKSQVLVLRGEAGSGRSALLDDLVHRLIDCRSVAVAGVEAEADLPYATLHRICAPMADRIADLPEAQRAALHGAFGLQVDRSPDAFLVGLATLGLLTGGEQPLLCVIDDAQWLDRASLRALAFASRRLRTDDRLAFVFAVRDTAPVDELTGLPELVLGGLNDEDARELLLAQISGPVDEQVRDRIVAEARGNPGALLELQRVLTPVDLAAGFSGADGACTGSSVDEAVLRDLDALPAATRLALVVAAAEPVGDAAVFWRALEHLQIGRGAVGSIEAAGLLDVGTRVRFRHPALRSSTYRAATLDERQDVHAALAAATDAAVDPDRRAWHRALAARGADAEVADQLEDAVEHVRRRAGVRAAAAFLDRAAALTPDPARRADRRLAAARAMRDAGALDISRRLLVDVAAAPAGATRSAEMACLRGELAMDQQLPREAAQLLAAAAPRFESTDMRRAAEVRFAALVASIQSGSTDDDAAVAALTAPKMFGRPRALDVLLDALARRVTDGQPTAAPHLIRALAHVEHDSTDLEADAACMVAVEVWDVEALRRLARQRVESARSAGRLVHLQSALDVLGTVELLSGATEEASALLEEARLLADRTGARLVNGLPSLLAAFRGDEANARAPIHELVEAASARSHRRMHATACYATAVLHNGLGNYDTARLAARDALAGDLIGWAPMLVAELAEAASRTGDDALLKEALDWVTDRASATPSHWALAIEARVRALLSGGDVASRLHQQSIEHLRQTPLRVELARGQLLYGEWLRRERRSIAARAELRSAYDAFAAMGLEAFATRARRELKATGETVRKRTVSTRFDLTPQEAEIGRLAGEGLTNPEIGAQLFISGRTVEWHLRKVFTKLGVTSRRQLRDRLPSPVGPFSPAPDPPRRALAG